VRSEFIRAVTKKVAALDDVTACRLVLMDQRFRKTRCSTSMAVGPCEKPAHVNQTTLCHIIVINFINYTFDEAKKPRRHYILCGKQILVKKLTSRY